MNKINFMENQGLFKRYKVVPGNKSYTTAVCGR